MAWAATFSTLWFIQCVFIPDGLLEQLIHVAVSVQFTANGAMLLSLIETQLFHTQLYVLMISVLYSYVQPSYSPRMYSNYTISKTQLPKTWHFSPRHWRLKLKSKDKASKRNPLGGKHFLHTVMWEMCLFQEIRASGYVSNYKGTSWLL